MTKVEMEAHRDAYQKFLDKARAALQAGLCQEAVDFAVSSWDHIDGMLQYERKYEGKDSGSIDAIGLVLQYAPPLLDFESLNKLETLLRSQRRLVKHSSVDLGDRLLKASSMMWEAQRFLNYLEKHFTVDEDNLSAVYGGDGEEWHRIAEAWVEMGFVHRVSEKRSHHFSLTTRMDQPILAKCPSCAAVAKAPKAKFLDELTCPKCRQKRAFVFLAKEPASRE